MEEDFDEEKELIKDTKEKNNKFFKWIKNKRCLVALLILLICLVGFIINILLIKNNNKIMTVADTEFYETDYRIYLKLAKDDYFGKEIEDIPEATLKTIVNQESNITVEQYLKQKTQENLKIAGIISKIAKDNNIVLSEENFKEIEADKEKLINSLGGKKEFNQWLNKNKTTEEAYDKMSQIEKLYSVIYNNLYTEGSTKDLTDEEKESVKATYKSDYKKIKQILLLKVNPQNLVELTEKEKQQKKLLADTVYAELKQQSDYSNFNDLIKKYSDDVIGEEEPESTYFKAGQLLGDIERVALNLKVGEISEVTESQYAYHIILREELDDGYLNKLYEEAREKKLLTDISKTMNNTAIIVENTLEKIEIN